ncbi:MAG: hypothetical protein IT580_11135 [Verrucomicrobiales bacterium]|nr:hypothetical protein [Verrucomicrobiales bacterium]
METVKRHPCPVCGYPGLSEPPRTRSGGGSYEICPSCGFQFGVSDDDAGETYSVWRERWRAAGMKWSSRGLRPPKDWDPATHVSRVESEALGAAPKRPKRNRGA